MAVYRKNSFVTDSIARICLPLSSPEYDVAYSNMLRRARRGFVADDQLIGMVRSRRSRHSGTVRNLIKGDVIESAGQTASSALLFEDHDTRQGNIEAHTIQIAEFGKRCVDTKAEMMFEHLNQITYATDNAVDAKGERLSIDMLIDLMEKVEWRFDEDGNVIRDGQAFVIHPDLAPRLLELEETQEHRDRLEGIRARKFEAWKASRRTRRIRSGANA